MIQANQSQRRPVVQLNADTELSHEEAAAAVERMRRLAKVLDSAFQIPGTKQTIGLDSLIGLIPGVGDVATSAVSALMLRTAVQIGARRRVIARMAANIAVDLLIGSIPVAGDLFDFVFKANRKNAALLEREFLRRRSP